MTSVKAGRDLIERGRSAGDDIADALADVRNALDNYLERADRLLAPFDRAPRIGFKVPVAIAAAGLVAGYLIGRRSVGPAPVTEVNGAVSPPVEPSMEVTTAVEVSRPQPAELDEIVPAGSSNNS